MNEKDILTKMFSMIIIIVAAISFWLGMAFYSTTMKDSTGKAFADKFFEQEKILIEQGKVIKQLKQQMENRKIT